MDILKQNRFLIGITILLVILNIASITTIFIGGPKYPPPGERMGPPNSKRVKELLRKELAFNDAQIDEYLAIRQDFQSRVGILHIQSRIVKKQMFERALQDNAPLELSDSLLAIILDKQAEVENLTYQHLHALTTICEKEQRGKLEHLVRKLIGPGPGGPPPQFDPHRPSPPRD